MINQWSVFLSLPWLGYPKLPVKDLGHCLLLPIEQAFGLIDPRRLQEQAPYRGGVMDGAQAGLQGRFDGKPPITQQG